MGHVFLNASVKNSIVDFLENKAEPYTKQDIQDPKARYSSATLINEWYEDQQKFAVLPKSASVFESEYMDKYRELCNYSLPDRQEYFKKIFDGQGLGQELLLDHQGFAYYNNFTTTYDLCFNHLKKGLCGPLPRKYRHGRYLPETDLSLIYGNLTQWGVREKIMLESVPVHEPEIPEAEYSSEYIPYNRGEVKKLNDFPYWGKKKSDLMAAKTKNDTL